MCGEQHLITSLYSLYLGSPPRVRGTVASAGSGSSNLRITPACAGNSWSVAGRPRCRWDHPRVCGEQRRKMEYIPPGLGITPACAGNSRLLPGWSISVQDHPRVCGEQAL